MTRSHNDLETSIFRKRRMYLRHKRLNDYLKWKLNTPAFLAYQHHKRGLSMNQHLGLTLQGLKPSMRMQAIQSQLISPPVETVEWRRYKTR